MIFYFLFFFINFNFFLKANDCIEKKIQKCIEEAMNNKFLL